MNTPVSPTPSPSLRELATQAIATDGDVEAYATDEAISAREYSRIVNDAREANTAYRNATLPHDILSLLDERDAILARAAWSLTLAKSALENWGRHHPHCAYFSVGVVEQPCDCGLAKAIREASEPS